MPASNSALDQLPVEVLLSLQEAMCDPSAEGIERARLRAADAGFHLKLGDSGVTLEPLRDAPPIAAPEAPEDAETDVIFLHFDDVRQAR